jgi:hypothetical protein
MVISQTLTEDQLSKMQSLIAKSWFNLWKDYWKQFVQIHKVTTNATSTGGTAGGGLTPAIQQVIPAGMNDPGPSVGEAATLKLGKTQRTLFNYFKKL